MNNWTIPLTTGFWTMLIFLAPVMVLNSRSAVPASEPEKPLFRFVQMSDTHCMFTNDLDKSHDFGGRVYSRSFEIFEGALGYVKSELKPAFIVHTGDMLESGSWPSGVDALLKVKALAAAVNVPFFFCFGNHEWDEDKYEQVFGLADYRYSYGNLIFIHLKASHRYPKLEMWDNAIPKHVLYQLDEYLSYCGGNVVIALHEPLVCHELEQSWARPRNHELAIKILERHPNVIMVLQGHTHFYFRERHGNIEYVICPGLVNSNKHPDERIDGKTPDTTMGHYLMAYDVYADCIRGSLYGAASTDEAVQGKYRKTDKMQFAVPLKEKMRLPQDPSKDLQARSLPNALNRYDPEIEAGMDGVALYLFDGWKFCADPGNRGKALGWQEGAFDDAAWKTNEHIQRNGFGWYRIRFVVPPCFRSDTLEAVLGKISDSDETYFNGSLIGKTGAFPPEELKPDSKETGRIYPLPGKLIQYGKTNVLAVRVFDAGAKGGLLGLPFIRFAGKVAR